MYPEQDEFFTMLYHKYFNQIKIYAWGLLSDPHRAEDVAQDTFYTAMEKIEDVMDAEEPIQWLKKTAKNKIHNEWRTRQRYLKRFLSLDAPEVPEVVSPVSVELTIIEREEDETRVPITATIRQVLTQEEVTLLKRIALEHVSHLEAAQELEISLWACQKRMQRIRGKLEKRFKARGQFIGRDRRCPRC